MMKNIRQYFVLICAFLLDKCSQISADTCPVYLTLSPLTKNLEESPLVINWGPDCESPPHWIRIYKENPAISNAAPIYQINVHNKSSGEVLTNQKFGKLNLPGGWSYDEVLKSFPKRVNNPICFNYYIVSYKNNELETFDCLKIFPNWMMSENHIGSVPLKDLFLPGTHCSGCYMTKANAKNNILRKLGYAQDLDIWSQLVFGIRYLDFGVGYFPSHNDSRNFWVMHDGLKFQHLTSILQDIRQFVILSEETVFLDMSSFPLGFHHHTERHTDLLNLLEEEIGDLVYKREEEDSHDSYTLTIDEMRKKGKYVLISYNHENSLNESTLVWKSWKKHSSSFLQPNELPEYMRNLFSGKLEHSPNEIGWCFYGIQGIQSTINDDVLIPPRDRANNINPKLMTMLGGPWSLNANAVLIDFFTNTNLIDMAVYTNQNKVIGSGAKTIFDIKF